MPDRTCTRDIRRETNRIGARSMRQQFLWKRLRRGTRLPSHLRDDGWHANNGKGAHLLLFEAFLGHGFCDARFLFGDNCLCGCLALLLRGTAQGLNVGNGNGCLNGMGNLAITKQAINAGLPHVIGLAGSRRCGLGLLRYLLRRPSLRLRFLRSRCQTQGFSSRAGRRETNNRTGTW